MRKVNKIQNRRIWFARWAKTPWAAFSSLCRVVHILYMNISSFKNTLLQQQGVVKDELLQILKQEFSSEDDDDDLLLQDLFLISLFDSVKQTRIDIATTYVVVLNYTHYFIPIYFAKAR